MKRFENERGHSSTGENSLGMSRTNITSAIPEGKNLIFTDPKSEKLPRLKTFFINALAILVVALAVFIVTILFFGPYYEKISGDDFLLMIKSCLVNPVTYKICLCFTSIFVLFAYLLAKRK